MRCRASYARPTSRFRPQSYRAHSEGRIHRPFHSHRRSKRAFADCRGNIHGHTRGTAKTLIEDIRFAVVITARSSIQSTSSRPSANSQAPSIEWSDRGSLAVGYWAVAFLAVLAVALTGHLGGVEVPN